MPVFELYKLPEDPKEKMQYNYAIVKRYTKQG